MERLLNIITIILFTMVCGLFLLAVIVPSSLTALVISAALLSIILLVFVTMLGNHKH